MVVQSASLSPWPGVMLTAGYASWAVRNHNFTCVVQMNLQPCALLLCCGCAQRPQPILVPLSDDLSAVGFNEHLVDEKGLLRYRADLDDLLTTRLEASASGSSGKIVPIWRNYKSTSVQFKLWAFMGPFGEPLG